MAKGSSPTMRTLQWLRDQNWVAQVVERWQPQSRRRIDLFGFIDIVAISKERGIVGIQCTSRANLNARIEKIKTECRQDAQRWLRAGGKILVIGWKKYKKKVDGKNWRITIVELTLSDFPSTRGV